jgi:hypothetical protein
MNVKNFKAVFFALIFLTSKIGVALNVHYCGGYIEGIVLAWNAVGCGMPLEKSQDSHQGFNFKKSTAVRIKPFLSKTMNPNKILITKFSLDILGFYQTIPSNLKPQKPSF